MILGLYLNFCAKSCTAVRVLSLTTGLSARALDTVDGEMFNSLAMSLIVTGCFKTFKDNLNLKLIQKWNDIVHS